MAPSLAPRTPCALLACAAIALPGCGGIGDRQDGQGAVSVYASAPLSGERAAQGRDAVDGARLALQEADGRAAGQPVELIALDDAGAGERWNPVATAANARRAAEDADTIAYLGELDSGATRVSLPITNRAGIPQVSFGAGAVELTRRAPGVEGSPDVHRPSGDPSFVRVVPDDAALGRAAGALAAAEGPRVTVVADGSSFGRGLAGAFEAEAEGRGATVVARLGPAPGAVERRLRMARPDAVFLAGEPDSIGAAALRAAIAAPGAALIATDAFLAPEAVAALGEGAEGMAIVAGPLDASFLAGPAAGRFASGFERRFGRPPGPYAAYGYEAMALLLDALERALDPGDRDAVREALLQTTERQSILGPYSITADGDTTLDAVTLHRVEGGEPVVERALAVP